MTISSMYYFIVLARERNFTRAAQQLHITQQSLSAHIATLEQELGCTLLIRRSPLRLTYAGTVFLRYAAAIQQELDNMHREFCDITENQKGVLKVGVAYTRGRTIMPRLIKRFQEEYPNIEVEIAEASNRMLHEHLLKGDLDLAIAIFPEALKGVELRDFYPEEVVLLAATALLEKLYPGSTDEVEARIAAGDWSVLSRCPFVLNGPSDIAGRIERELFERAGFQPIAAASSSNSETLLSLCVEGVGACFCPANLADACLSREQMAALTIFRLGKEGQYPIRFGYLKNTYQWNIISEFMRISSEVMGRD